MFRFLVFLVVLLFPVLAFAQDVEVPSALYTLLDTLLNVLLPILTILGSYAVWKAKKWFEAKTKFDIPEKYDSQLDRWVEKGVVYAGEKARTALKNNEEKLTMGKKKELALSYVNDMIEQYNLPQVAEEKLTKMVEAKLGYVRPNPSLTD